MVCQMTKLMVSEKKFGKYLQEMELVKIKCLTQRSSGLRYRSAAEFCVRRTYQK